MEPDRNGFPVPRIQDSCTGCGACLKICPAADKTLSKNNARTYAVMDTPEERRKSSSGGMFGIMARKILQNGGLVCGAAYSEDYLSVNHIIISDAAQLDLLRGSKYVQSSTGECFQAVERQLKAGRQVLFSGTPCQVDGLRHFLRTDYKNLILVDIVCHGVPSPLVYRKYISENKPGKLLQKVDFREKAHWGWGTASSIFADNRVYRKDCYTDPYWKAFLGGMSTRACCGECKYASMSRYGDITIGDFWGVSEIAPAMDDRLGTSLVLVNTDKGKKFWDSLKKGIPRQMEIPPQQVYEGAKKHNGQLIGARKSHWARSRFFELLSRKSVADAYQWAETSHYDVGVTGWWYNENYGGALTYYALNRVLAKMGLSVLMIAKCSDAPDYRPNAESIPYRFALKHYRISKNYTHKSIQTLNRHCDAFISGSDQLFNPYLWEYSGPQYFLDYAGIENRIISYASSFGNISSIPEAFRMKFSYLLHRFDALSVREDYAVPLCEEAFGITPQKVLDPVFLCDMKEYDRLADASGLSIEEPYLLSFFLDPDNAKRDAVLYLSQKLGFKSINLLNATDFENNKKKLNLENTKTDIDVEEWIYYYKHASFIITDSFHGTCFAILFQKPFISVANLQRGERRFVSMLKEAGLLQYLVYDLNDIRTKEELFRPIDYHAVRERLDPLCAASYTWLENTLKKPRNAAQNMFRLLDGELTKLRKEIEDLKGDAHWQER